MIPIKSIFVATIFGLSNPHALADLSPEAARSVCLELGLTPESMTALGLSSNGVSSLFSRISESDTSVSQLRTLQAQSQSTQAALKEAQKSIRLADTNTQANQIEAAIDSLKLQAENLSSQIEQLQDQIRNFALPSNLSSAMVERVCEPEGLVAVVPPEYRVIALLDDDYAELLPALAAEQHALSIGEQVDNSTSLILGRFRNLPEIQNARSNMLLHLDAARVVFFQ